ncbi:formate dehydrogenase accessory sulfurtransferase FdhD [Methylophilus sp. Leaf414]|uniref:formate dehydrogenase accessory sulfurtransferase FdhD n=1 Tax=Methylophilus sp. Leaf414 TaxID=1736371 RepID=UPI0006F9B7DC|nr:formate dehydrogenase accessory sulfurtransferase FdhD [Methylophilus sp. Leaf414]KQT36116.1 formate dehydrogenase family accessory protein FdhD [Methylophilus sp. Leaf414]
MAQPAIEYDDCPIADTSNDWQPLTAYQAGHEFEVTRWRNGQPQSVVDTLAQEVPVALVYNGISHVVMLATPADLEDFAYGFSFTEGIISERAQIYGIDAKAIHHANGLLKGIELHIELATAQFAALKEQRRNLTGRTGCGLCGAESLDQVFKIPSLPTTSRPNLSLQAIDTAIAQLKSQQPLQQITGATHACAIVNDQGDVLHVREDVGRHNALDKLIGLLLRQNLEFGELWSKHWVLTTSRASYEMVQKVSMTGGRALVAISAPTALAVNLAQEQDFLLVGFARPAQCVVYHGELTG